MTRKQLTSRQVDVLGVVNANGPLTARDIGEHHLQIGISSVRSALAALERRGFVTTVLPVWTSRRRARGYQITSEGADAVRQEQEREA